MRVRARRAGPGKVVASITAMAIAAVIAVALTGCGSSSSGAASARTLLHQTFDGGQTVSSGVLALDLAITPSAHGSQPVTLVLHGPFQSGHAGAAAQSDFTMTIGTSGARTSFGVLSTATGAYFKLQGAYYRLPASESKQLTASLPTAGAGLTKLGINPLRWLTQPRIVGHVPIDGVQTTEIRAGVALGPLLHDLDSLLGQESSNPTLKAAGLPKKLSAAEIKQIEAAVRTPTVTLFTGRSDSVLRRFVLDLRLPTGGATGRQLGSVAGAAVHLQLDDSDLNQPQRIAAPAHVLPYAQLANQLAGLFGSSTATGSGSAGTSGSQAYATCVSKAGADVAKLQTCASLIDATTD